MGRGIACCALISPTLRHNTEVVIGDYCVMSDQPQLTAEEYFDRAIKHDQKWNFVDAIQDFTAALDLRPDWIEAYWGRANARHNSGDYEGELHDVEEILRLEPQNERANLWHNMILSRPKSSEEALNQLLSSVDFAAADRSKMKIYGFSLARFAQMMPDKRDEIERVLGGITTINPITGHLAQGAYLQAKNEREKAVEAYTEAIQLDPQLAEAYLERASTYGGFGRFQEAFADYTRVLELYALRGELPFNVARVYQLRGTSRGYRGDLGGAIDDLNQSIQLRSGNAEAYFQRGTFREQKEDFEGAIADYTSVIESGAMRDVLGRKETAYINRGRLREDQDDLAGAIADWETYLALDRDEKFGDHAEIQSWIAEVKVKLASDK
jgi:tetratricopeptide (TPR) repeat protein